MTTYEKSNSITELPKLSKLKAPTKKIFKALFEANSLSLRQLSTLSNAICKDLGVKGCPLRYGGRQPHRNSGGRLRSKTYGKYQVSTTIITLYKHTAKTGKVVANKTTLDTLLHELCHHFDFTLIGLNNSKHTAGFYKRITSLKQALLS